MITKKISPKGNSVRVTFSLPADAASESVSVVGQFNEWDQAKGAMKLDAKKGFWTKGISIKPGSTHQFRYVLDGGTWLNDDQADSFVSNEYSEQNGVVQA